MSVELTQIALILPAQCQKAIQIVESKAHFNNDNMLKGIRVRLSLSRDMTISIVHIDLYLASIRKKSFIFQHWLVVIRKE